MGLLALVIAQARDLVPRGQLRAGIAGRLFPMFFLLIIGVQFWNVIFNILIHIHLCIYIYILNIFIYIYVYILYICINIYIYIYYVIIGFDPSRYKYDIIMMFHCIPYAYMIQIPEVELNPWGLYKNYITNMENEPTNIAYTHQYYIGL